MFKTMTGSLDPKKSPSEEDIEKIPSYLFAKWLSGNPHTIMAANQFNLYSKIPIQNQYNVIKSAFCGKIKFIPYPKNTSNDINENIKYLMEYFNISEREARMYHKHISDTEMSFIANLYKEHEMKK